MKTNVTFKRKILTKIVIGIALYGVVFFMTTIFLTPFINIFKYQAYTVNNLATLLAGLASVLYVSSDKDSNIYYDKEAKFVNNPLFILFVVLSSYALTVSFNFLFAKIPWEIFGNKNVVQDNDYFYAIPLSIRLISYVIIAPFAEEALFRGAIFFRFKKILPVWAAAICTGMIFGIYHLNLMQGIYAFVMGSIMCLVFHYGGSIFYAMLFHMIANLISNLCFENQHIYNVIYSPVSIILSIAYVVVAITLCLVFKHRLTKKDKKC